MGCGERDPRHVRRLRFRSGVRRRAEVPRDAASAGRSGEQQPAARLHRPQHPGDAEVLLTGPLRSLMFVPSHRERMVERALATPELDVAILDLEDGVPNPEKEAGRARLRAVLASGGMPRPARFVRVNGAASGQLNADLDAVVRQGLDGLVLPKVDGVAELAEALRVVGERERVAGLAPLPIVVSIESARGLLAAAALAAEPRATALLFGAEDFALDLALP